MHRKAAMHRLAGHVCDISAISSFPPLRAEENWKIDFTADESGGKPAIASFPPLGEEENWKVDLTADESGGKAATASFPPSERRKAGNCSFTADEGGGKGPTASFPPLRVEEYLKMRAYRPCRQR
ncbi:hypothetical protein AAC387_Pa04g0092 [Persea americana]